MQYPCVRQQDEVDCAAACVASIARFYGQIFSVSHVREAIGTSQNGTTLGQLRKGVEELRFNARSRKAPVEKIDVHQIVDAICSPAIIHWKGYHYVVLYGRRGKKYIIADPAFGKTRFISEKELLRGWVTGAFLWLEPTESFSDQPNDKISGIGQFFKRVWRYRAILAEALLCALTMGLLSLASPYLIQVLTDNLLVPTTDKVLVEQKLRLLSQLSIAIMTMSLVSSSLQLVQSNLIAHFAQRLELGLVLEFGRKILRLPLPYYEKRRSGEIVSRLQDIQKINQLVSQAVIRLPSQGFIAIIALGCMLLYSQELTLAAVLIAAITTSSTFCLRPFLRHKFWQALSKEAENQGFAVENFKGASTIKTIGAEAELWDKFQQEFNSLARLNFQTIQIGIVNNVFTGFMSSAGSIALLWLGSYLVLEGKLATIGQLLAFNAMNSNFLAFVGTLVGFVNGFTEAKLASQRLREAIDSPAEDEEDVSKADIEISSDADICCMRIKFNHPSRKRVLEDFSAKIPGGKVTALIGKSGCGKSTLAKLIARLYVPEEGGIHIGSYSLQDLRLDCIRQQVVLVLQDTHFWKRSITENFKLSTQWSNPFRSKEDILSKMAKAFEITGAKEFIDSMGGYDIELGEFGANLSGGQRQRLAIARAIVKDPPILILDESTSALDPDSEAQVLDRLLSHRRGKTTILISHRPQVINRADWVIYLEHGRVDAQGTSEELRIQPGGHQDFL